MMQEYTDTPSRGKFGLLPDGTLGYPATAPTFFDAVDFGSDNLPREPRKFEPCISPYILPDDYQHVTHIDWFRATAKGADVLHTIGEICDLLVYDQKTGEVDTDIEFKDVEKTLLNYPKQRVIVAALDSGQLKLGSIAYDDNPMSGNLGVMVDIAGAGMAYLRVNAPHKLPGLRDLLAGYGYTISRIDIALDLPGDYCRSYGVTVPSIRAKHRDGDMSFNFASTGRFIEQFKDDGDWFWNSCDNGGGVSWQQYDPQKYAPRGLTHNIGSRKGSFFCRAYEKSKQLISTAEIGDDHDLDLWAVRLEVEYKKDKNQSPLPWDMLTSPDAFFLAGRQARQYMTDYRATLHDGEISELMRLKFAKHQVLSLRAKIHWGHIGYGRLLKTLLDSGLTKEEVFDKMVRDVGLKDFIYDLDELDTETGETVNVDPYPYYSIPSSPLAVALRKSLGIYQDLPGVVVC